MKPDGIKLTTSRGENPPKKTQSMEPGVANQDLLMVERKGRSLPCIGCCSQLQVGSRALMTQLRPLSLIGWA